jgi:hypothetical protein
VVDPEGQLNIPAESMGARLQKLLRTMILTWLLDGLRRQQTTCMLLAMEDVAVSGVKRFVGIFAAACARGVHDTSKTTVHIDRAEARCVYHLTSYHNHSQGNLLLDLRSTYPAQRVETEYTVSTQSTGCRR